MRRRFWSELLPLLVLLSFGLGTGVHVAGAAERVRIRESGSTLRVDTGALRLEMEFASEGGVLLHSFALKGSRKDWVSKGEAAGINLRSEGVSLNGLAAGQGFQHAGRTHRMTPQGAREVRIELEHAAAKLRATLLLTAFPGSPVIDLRLRLRNHGQQPIRNLSRFDPLSIALALEEKPLRAHWVTRNNYALQRAEVSEALTVDGGDWNGPKAAGWLALEDATRGEFLVAGIEWERQWAFDLQPEGEGKELRLTAGLRRGATVDLAPGASLESPRVFVGLARGDLDDAANVTRDYLLDHVLAPAPGGFPHVVYNIWSTEQEGVEQRLSQEARFAAERLGVEVFYHDAAWYRDSDVTGKERWGVGLGSYTEDRRKLPGGLRGLSDTVHGLGMKFGLWVCPEMVDVTAMEREIIPDRWMTMAKGEFNTQKIDGWNPMKMLCLGSPEVEEHLRQQLLRLARGFRLDWLKWDASGLPGLDIACDRTDHGHQAGNGSLAAMAGKYRILDSLYAQNPSLILEQCSYGTRLDYGMGRRGARANWLSDSTAPSSHVRENVMAATYVLPASHVMTWVMRDAEVGQPQPPIFLDTIFRSRMMGGFGFGTLHGSLSESVSLYPPTTIEAAVRNIQAYKGYRHLLGQHTYHLTPLGQTNAWQAMQFAARDRREGIAFFFRNNARDTDNTFKLRGLAPRTEYEIISLNDGSVRYRRGSQLMREGIGVTLSRHPEESEVLRLKARGR